MSHHASPHGEADRSEELRSEPALPDAIQTTETYETEEGTVFYDAENPTCWLEADTVFTLKQVV